MQFHEQFLRLHKQYFATRHAFSASNIAFLCLMVTDQKRRWTPRDFADQFGFSYIGARQNLQRIKAEGFCTGDGMITAAGLNAVGYGQQGA